ncbi:MULTISPECIES: hypothetical protein [unclassified Kitasatospora]|uniref:hypothetical protein n=1 Tax=unclassified Kitasatospora TaxID=2633591 RepID=UPI001ADFA5E7|nr:hypothetical protein [Kitasatospora sp. RG8]MBP0450805.1 hypothetical protein [Kitasatospora sp. RG8]
MATRLARRAVEAVAPQELAQFAMTAEAFHSTPPRKRLQAVRRDEPLGLGLETAAALLSTAALAVAVRVLDHLTERAAGQAADTAERGVRALFRRRRAEPAAEAVERLSAEQLTTVRQVAVDAALRLRVPEEQARTIADGIVAELVTMARGPAREAGRGEDAGEAAQ